METLLVALLGLFAGILINRTANRLYRRVALESPDSAWRFFVAIASAILTAYLYARFGASTRLALAALYTAVFLLVFITDIEHHLIFNAVILPATIFAALAAPFSHLGVVRSLLGGALAYALVFLIFILAPIIARLRKREIDVPFGFGDVKLAGFMGIVVGFPAVLNAIVATILLGGIGAILVFTIQFARTRRIALDTAMPYGPYFCIAGWWFMVM